MVDKNVVPDKEQEQVTLKMTVKPDLEYCFRDLVNIHVAAEEVILEFGNRHRGTPDQATIMNRIVLSPTSAMRLVKGLTDGMKARADAQSK